MKTIRRKIVSVIVLVCLLVASVNIVQVSNVSLASIDSYFQSGYIAYRYDDRNNVTYEHCCSIPIDGDTCAECDYDASVATTMSLTSANKPASLNVGQSFSIKGVINSNYKIREVAVGVYTTSGKKVISASATPWTNSYNIVDLDAKIKFGSLTAGTYVYKVIATDTKGTKTLLSKTFTVK